MSSTYKVDNIDSTSSFQDGDKNITFDLSNITGGANRSIIIPDNNLTLVGLNLNQTLINKTINATNNTITNIANNEIKSGAGIDATKIADGSVSNTKFQYLNGLSSAAVGISDSQTITNKTFTDTSTYFQDNGDNTKKFQFELSGITSNNTRILTVPDGNITLVGASLNQTLTNKTINTSSNTLVIAASDVSSGTFDNSRIQQSNVTQHQGAIDHGSISGLSDDDHSQYLLLSGRTGGQVITGGTASGNDLTLNSTSNATKGDIILNDILLTKKRVVLNDQGYATTYAASVQSANNYAWLEILNNGGTDKGIFFGIQNNDFELWSYQGGDIKYYVSPTATDGTNKFTMQKDGVFRIHDLTAGVIKSSATGVLSSETTNTGFNKSFGTSAGTVLEGSHSTASTGIHGISGSIVGTIDTQTLTNKTINTASNTLVIDTSDITSGTLSVSRGGIGATTLTANGILKGNGTSAITSIKSEWNKAAAPTSTDDTASNYEVGSRWIDTTANKEYICLDATTSSAIWTETTKNGDITASSNINSSALIIGDDGAKGVQHLWQWTGAGNGAMSAIVSTVLDGTPILMLRHNGAGARSFLEMKSSTGSDLFDFRKDGDEDPIFRINSVLVVKDDVIKIGQNTATTDTNYLLLIDDGKLGISNSLEDKIGIQAPSSSFTDYTLTLPTSDGGNGEYLKTDGSGTLSWDSPIGAGEANTASNIGTGGVGVFKQKNGVDLEFKKINSGSNKITITDDTGNNEVDIDIAESNIAIDNLSGAPTGTVVGTTDTQTLTNKTIDADNNTITNIDNNEIKAGAAIDATKIANGSVSNTEFQYLNSVTSNVQTQIDGKIDYVETNLICVENGSPGSANHIQFCVTKNTTADTYNLGIDTGDPCKIIFSAEDGGQRQATVLASDGNTTATIFGVSRSINSGASWQPVIVARQDQRVGIGNNSPTDTLDVTGNIVVSGTVDGRDINTDGTNLDNHIAATTAHGVSGSVVGTTDAQVLINKTINTVSNTITIATSDITSGTLADARIAASNVTQHEGSINHDNLSGFVANEHIDHSTVSITAGVGLSGGGTIATTRTIDLDINSLTADSSPNGAADYIVTYDSSATGHKKVLLNNIPKYNGTAIGDILIYDGTTYTNLARGSEGQVLTVNTSYDIDIAWENANSHIHSASDITSGTLSVSRGGIGTNTLTQDGWLIGNGTGSVSAIKNNMNASVAPSSSTDDVTLGYAVGSRWFDTTADKEYVCLDATDGAAVWTETTQGAGGDVTGPASSTDNAIVRFNGTGGKTIQNSSVTIDDNGVIAGTRTITPANNITWNLGSGSLKWNWIYGLRTVMENGTAAQPSYSFSSDADCGMYRSDTNEISFATAGTQQVIINSSGEVGFGGSPVTDYRLAINNPSGKNGFCVHAGEVLGDIAFHISDADDTFQIMEMEADQGYCTFGKTYAQTLTDNSVVYGIDVQHTSGSATDFNTQSGIYRIGGTDVVDVSQVLTNKTITATSNNVTAKGLHTATTTVSVSAATAPTSGQVLTATNNTTATWQTPSDVSGPGSSSDMVMVRFNGTTGKLIEGVGIRHYGASATNPSSPTPQDGDKYYNTAINHEMCYDGSRSKWLSVAIIMDGAGRNGTTAANVFYKRWNGMALAAAQGPHVPKGTIIRVGYSTSTAVTHTYEVLVGGKTITSLASGGAASAFSDTVNADFDAGIMSSKNASGSATTTNFQSVIYYKLRV